ncbi:MAG: 2-isopropylmalate synthase [Cyanobacteria bacterium J06649_4]
MLQTPARKYTAFTPVKLSDRTWPNRVITAPPTWLSTDLRDGNQALAEPMDIARKLRMFRMLVAIGFKEIEVGFPAASETEFNFVRRLIEQHLIPDDVTIQVLTPARENLIRRTFEALHGVKQAIVHVYNATAPVFRQVVFNLDKPSTVRLATEAASLIKQLAAGQSDTHWRFQYSPEVFTSTELSFAREICNAVLHIWQPTQNAKAIINLPASVEVSTPNIFADQVEWMHRQLDYREATVLCVHPHNDRGCSIAAAELGQMAGAQRVEGCLFGNGERTGNVDLLTLAMNLYTQGISPGLDFSNLDDIIRVAEDCTQIPVHPRHPYAGELVFTAFSGSHQDAIKKGFAVRSAAISNVVDTNVADSEQVPWQVPYLPMDPADVGRSYESVVRVNSQSGKGGIAFLLEKDYGLSLPRALQIELSQLVQSAVDGSGKEISAEAIWTVFCREYHRETGTFIYRQHQSSIQGDQQTALTLGLSYQAQHLTLSGVGNGPIDAFLSAINADSRFSHLGKIQIRHYEERVFPEGEISEAASNDESDASLSHGSLRDSFLGSSHRSGSQRSAIALIEIASQSHSAPAASACRSSFGLGIHENIVIASFQAIISALNRLHSQLPVADQTTNPVGIGNAVSPA